MRLDRHTSSRDTMERESRVGNIDLHIHTGYSADGEFTPSRVIDLCVDLGMKAISVTDHNSVRGIREALTYGKNRPVQIIPGIEIDCTFRSIDLHLLGYGIDIRNTEFDDLEQSVAEQGKNAFPLMMSNLEKIGILVDPDEVLAAAKGKVVTGELIGEVLLNQQDSATRELLKPYFSGGSRSNNPYLNFYLDYFAQGKPAYVPIRYMPLQDAVSLVKRSGGIPVLAHPGNNLRNRLYLLDEIMHAGVEGIEVFSSYHTPDQIDYFLDAARRNNVLITCGSDFHGKNKPSIKIGDCRCTTEEQSIIDSFSLY